MPIPLTALSRQIIPVVLTPAATVAELLFLFRALFNGPRTPEGLRQLAPDLRTLPHGSRVRVVVESQQFILPWALLYDIPGPVSAATLDWSGFWGYRYILDALPPGRYPAPTLAQPHPAFLLLLHDGVALRAFTEAQATFATTELTAARASVAWGSDSVRQALAEPGEVVLIYCYCHGRHISGAVQPAGLTGESALAFSRDEVIRLADLRRLPVAFLTGQPLVFLNACEGATQDGFFYDGFMPYFIEEQGACGFIGTEVKAPQLLAHDFALRFLGAFAGGQRVGEILWKLRRHYLDTCHTILGFNYSLYCLSDLRLKQPISN